MLSVSHIPSESESCVPADLAQTIVSAVADCQDHAP